LGGAGGVCVHQHRPVLRGLPAVELASPPSPGGSVPSSFVVEDVSVRRPLWWHVLPHRRALLVDLAILLFLGVIHIAAWVELDLSRHRSNDPFETANRVRDTTAVGLTVVGILLPLTALGIQTLANRLRTALQEKEILTRASIFVLLDFFVACIWFVISLSLGLYVLYFGVYKGYTENLLTYRHIGMIIGFQLFFLLVGVLRLVWALGTLIAGLLSITTV